MKPGTKVLVTHKPVWVTSGAQWTDDMDKCIGKTMIVVRDFDTHEWVSLELPGEFQGMLPRDALKVLSSAEIHTNDIVRVVRRDNEWAEHGHYWTATMDRWVGEIRKVASFDPETRIARLQDPRGTGIFLWYPEHVLEKIEDDAELRDEPVELKGAFPFKVGDMIRLVRGRIMDHLGEGPFEVIKTEEEIDGVTINVPDNSRGGENYIVAIENAEIFEDIDQPIPYSVDDPRSERLDAKLKRKKEKLRKEGRAWKFFGARFRLPDGREVETPCPEIPGATEIERSSSVFRHEAWPPAYVTDIVCEAIVVKDHNEEFRIPMESDNQRCWFADMGVILCDSRAQLLEDWIWTVHMPPHDPPKDERLELLKKLW